MFTDIERFVVGRSGIDVLERVGVIGAYNRAGEVEGVRAVLRRERLDVEAVAEGLALGSDLQPGQIEDESRAGSERDLKVDLADLKTANFAGVDVLKRGLGDVRAGQGLVLDIGRAHAAVRNLGVSD